MRIKKAENYNLKYVSIIYLDSWRTTYKCFMPQNYLDSLSYTQFEEKLLKYQEKQGNEIFIAFDNKDQVIAFISYTPCQKIENCLLLDSLHVIPEAQNKGVGKLLISHFFKRAQELGYKSASVEVIKGNDRAESIYKHLGAKFAYDFTTDYDSLQIESKLLVWHNLLDFKN